MSTISHLHDVTLFAPSNAALEDPVVKQILQDKKRVREILNLHYVKERLPLEKIKDKSFSQVSRFSFFTHDDKIWKDDIKYMIRDLSLESSRCVRRYAYMKYRFSND